MALRVQIVDSLGSLLAPLAELLATPSAALLLPELVAIPGIGVRLWLPEGEHANVRAILQKAGLLP